MSTSDLDIAFFEAVERVNNSTEPFPADFLLRLYAYYKRATNNDGKPSSSRPIINAFKMNALLQMQDISPEQAKQEYIALVNSYFE
ncbi:acyl-CoA-binding protein [Kordia periserrulae]|uniref:Acyl-CoA-binding protein n=1 Tax=Kordia periserrulae TaxID=701523 RepID=A0A2T6C581_9FLAO|nr:acyl-CoA-binding protein [Kordia periserrulae]PTX63465.1 acyl-CoA-binding protein [Kordia periserrulae]